MKTEKVIFTAEQSADIIAMLLAEKIQMQAEIDELKKQKPDPLQAERQTRGYYIATALNGILANPEYVKYFRGNNALPVLKQVVELACEISDEAMKQNNHPVSTKVI